MNWKCEYVFNEIFEKEIIAKKQRYYPRTKKNTGSRIIMSIM